MKKVVTSLSPFEEEFEDENRQYFSVERGHYSLAFWTRLKAEAPGLYDRFTRYPVLLSESEFEALATFEDPELPGPEIASVHGIEESGLLCEVFQCGSLVQPGTEASFSLVDGGHSIDTAKWDGRAWSLVAVLEDGPKLIESWDVREVMRAVAALPYVVEKVTVCGKLKAGT